MASNWGAENPVKNAQGQSDRAARQAKIRQQVKASQTAGRGKRRI